MNDQTLVVQQRAIEPISFKEITDRVDLIHRIQHEVMKSGVHYGTVPGVPKPFLFKPGAEVLCMAFQFGVRYRETETAMEGGHRRFDVVAEIFHQPTGNLVAEGLGTCNTLERKYWIQTVQANDGTAARFQPEDFYNTCKKMAAKRAKVDGTITATNASNVFTQDEDSPGLHQDKRGASTQDSGEKKVQGIVADARSREDAETKVTWFNATIGGKNIWTKEVELGQELLEANGTEVIATLKAGKKANSFRLIQLNYPATETETEASE